MVMLMVFAVFYVCAIIIAFYAYREFKGMLFDNGQGTQGGLANLLPFSRGMGGGNQS